MMKFIRYALATFCFAASVGCLALWGWTTMHSSISGQASYSAKSTTFDVQVGCGYCFLHAFNRANSWSASNGWTTRSVAVGDEGLELFHEMVERQGKFGGSAFGFYFPLWYPASIFALAGISVLRFRRQFSIRTALITTTVVAALIGMAVIL